MLAQVYTRLGLTGVAARQAHRAEACFRVYRQRAEALLALMDRTALRAC
jgi:hypothetical protein